MKIGYLKNYRDYGFLKKFVINNTNLYVKKEDSGTNWNFNRTFYKWKKGAKMCYLSETNVHFLKNYNL